MNYEKSIADHYTTGGLLKTILNRIRKVGKTVDTIQLNDLAPLDEFHVGGRKATPHLLDSMEFQAGMHVLDIGCGLGGADRFTANHFGCEVSGIDLNQEFIETGIIINARLKLETLVALKQASALQMPFEESNFDGAYMMHVGMNISNKEQLFR